MPGPYLPLSTLRGRPYGRSRMTRGRRGSLRLRRMTLSFTAPRRCDRRTEDPMSLFNRFTHVSVTVTDVAKAREFYSNVLGFQEIARPAFNFPGIWYSLGGDLQLHIILNDALVRPAVERETIEARYPHFALWTDDCDATAAKIEALGLVCRDVFSGPTGLRQVFVKDPDGNMVEFIGPSKKAGARVMESAGTHQ